MSEHTEAGAIAALAMRANGPHVAHIARLELPYSEEWKLWTAASGRLMAQLEFARFIEENAADIVAPSAGELLDACRDLQVHRKVSFVKAVRTASDNESFEYADDLAARTGCPAMFGRLG